MEAHSSIGAQTEESAASAVLERWYEAWNAHDVVELGRQTGLVPPRSSRMEKLSRRLQPLTARRMRRRGPAARA